MAEKLLCLWQMPRLINTSPTCLPIISEDPGNMADGEKFLNKPILWVILGSALLATAYIISVSHLYSGSAAVYYAFNLSFMCLLLLCYPRPRSYAYLFFAVFLFLGFWVKFTVHNVIAYEFIEPTGDFDGQPETWDLALKAASAAAIGVCLPRILQLALAFTPRFQFQTVSRQNIAGWYLEWRIWLWAMSFFLIVAFCIWNYKAAFYQIGVDAKVILPLHLNVFVSMLTHSGFIMWVCVLVHVEEQIRHLTPIALMLPFWLEGLFVSISALSRSLFIFHVAPVVAVFWFQSSKYIKRLNLRTVLYIVVFLVIALAASITAVTFGRIETYYMEQTSAETYNRKVSNPVDQNELRRFLVHDSFRQVLKLFVDRWVGLEGVLTISAYNHRGIPLLSEAIREDPQRGAESIYQKISASHTHYPRHSNHTFLTLPGIAAVLFYSDSIVIVAIGMLLASTILIIMEFIIFRLSQNHFLVAYLGLALANILCQLNFPYLGGVNVALVFSAAMAMALIQRRLAFPYKP